MKYYIIDPDVPGHLEETLTQLRSSRELSEVHYTFECWPKDDILQAHPVFLVSEPLAQSLTGLSGFQLKTCVGAKSEQFDIASPGCGTLPNFLWLDVFGAANIDDFGISDNLMLVISQRALDTLTNFTISNSEITLS